MGSVVTGLPPCASKARPRSYLMRVIIIEETHRYCRSCQPCSAPESPHRISDISDIISPAHRRYCRCTTFNVANTIWPAWWNCQYHLSHQLPARHVCIISSFYVPTPLLSSEWSSFPGIIVCLLVVNHFPIDSRVIIHICCTPVTPLCTFFLSLKLWSSVCNETTAMGPVALGSKPSTGTPLLRRFITTKNLLKYPYQSQWPVAIFMWTVQWALPYTQVAVSSQPCLVIERSISESRRECRAHCISRNLTSQR